MCRIGWLHVRRVAYAVPDVVLMLLGESVGRGPAPPAWRATPDFVLAGGGFA